MAVTVTVTVTVTVICGIHGRSFCALSVRHTCIDIRMRTVNFIICTCIYIYIYIYIYATLRSMIREHASGRSRSQIILHVTQLSLLA
jgi:hypothetical protein